MQLKAINKKVLNRRNNCLITGEKKQEVRGINSHTFSLKDFAMNMQNPNTVRKNHRWEKKKENWLKRDIIGNSVLSTFSPLSPSLSAGEFKTVSNYLYSSLTLNSRQDENNPVYSIMGRLKTEFYKCLLSFSLDSLFMKVTLIVWNEKILTVYKFIIRKINITLE